MWLFLPSGLLMPADVPMNLADKRFTKGYRDFQVRARVRSHLENFIRERMEPLGLDYSEIEATPKMDYDYRFYTRRSDFSIAITDEIMAIDYEKFKPTAERRDAKGRMLYVDGKEYHSKLNSIWGTVASLGNPYGGGSWGGYSQGYKYSGGSHKPVGGKKSDKATVTSSAYTPSSFGPVEKVTSKRPTAGSLAAAGISDPESVLEAWDRQEAAEQAAIEAEQAAMALDGLTDEEIEAFGSIWGENLADYQDAPEDFDRDILAPEESAMHEVSDEDLDERPSQYKTASQILLIAKHLPMTEWSKVFDEDELDFLMTQGQEVDSVSAEVTVKEHPATQSPIPAPKAEDTGAKPLLSKEVVQTAIKEIQASTKAEATEQK